MSLVKENLLRYDFFKTWWIINEVEFLCERRLTLCSAYCQVCIKIPIRSGNSGKEEQLWISTDIPIYFSFILFQYDKNSLMNDIKMQHRHRKKTTFLSFNSVAPFIIKSPTVSKITALYSASSICMLVYHDFFGKPAWRPSK